MKNFFLFILFICLLPHIYAMEKLFISIQEKFEKAIEDANRDLSEKTFKEIENCLNQGADINFKMGPRKATPIICAINNSNKKLFKLLLQYGADINAWDDYENTPLYIVLTNQKLADLEPAIFDIEEDFLKHGANPNIKKNGDTHFHNVVKYKKHKTIDFMRLLIKYGAKIDEKDKCKWTPLRHAIQNSNFEIIKELCNLGASLIDIDDCNCNAFHVAIKEKLSKDYINLLIINSHFNYNKEVDEQLKATVKTALLTFNRLASDKNSKFPILPQEIQLIIFSHLKLNNLYGFNRKLCQQLEAKNIKNILLNYTLKKANCLENVLQSTNWNYNAIFEETALQTLYNKHQNDLLYIQEVESLIDPKKLHQDRIDFMNGSTRDDNLVVQIYEHNKKLLLKS